MTRGNVRNNHEPGAREPHRLAWRSNPAGADGCAVDDFLDLAGQRDACQMRSLLNRESKLAMATCSVRARSANEHRFEGSDHSSIELTLNGLSHSKPRYLASHRVTIRALRSHRVVGVGDRNDPRKQRDLFANKTIRIATAVNPLVVMPDDAGYLRVILNIGKDALADYGVLLHLSALFKR
jgi:hypothetical protein